MPGARLPLFALTMALAGALPSSSGGLKPAAGPSGKAHHPAVEGCYGGRSERPATRVIASIVGAAAIDTVTVRALDAVTGYHPTVLEPFAAFYFYPILDAYTSVILDLYARAGLEPPFLTGIPGCCPGLALPFTQGSPGFVWMLAHEVDHPFRRLFPAPIGAPAVPLEEPLRPDPDAEPW